MLLTYLIANASPPADFVREHLGKYNGYKDDGVTDHFVPVLMVNHNGKLLIVACAGGTVIDGEVISIGLTPIGELITRTAATFVHPDNGIVLRHLRCNGTTGELKRKIMEAFDMAQCGDLVLFVADMAGECDGKLLAGVLKPLRSVKVKTFRPFPRGDLGDFLCLADDATILKEVSA